MKNFTNCSYLFVLLLSICFYSSCSDDLNEFDDRVDTQREFAVPLFNSTTSVTDLLDGLSEETFVTMGPDDLITLNYKGNVTERTGEELFDFVEGIPILMSDTVTSIPFNIEGEVDLTLMRLKAGSMTILFQNNQPDTVDLKVSIPQLSKDGVYFEKTTVLDPDESFSTGIGSLDGYEIQSSTDSVTFYYEAYLRTTGERVKLTSPLGALLNVEFSYIEGYWGTDTLDLERDTIEIEFFEKWSQGEVYFDEPRIQLDVLNSFGFPVRSIVNTMNILSVDGDSIELESPFINDGINFEYPLISELGEVKTTTFYFDKDNSNVVDVLSAGPVFVDYDVDAMANPNGFTELGFMTDESMFRVQVSVELPFHARIIDFKANDVFNIDFDGYNDVEYIEFKMITENQIPLGVDVQVYFADENKNVIDSLFTNEENILDPAPVDSNGDVNGQSEKTTFMTIDAAKFERVKNAKKLLLEAKFSTSDATNGQMVNIRDGEKVDIRMGMKIGTK